MLIILIVIVGLSLLILGHEAGHFLTAKAFGLKVDEFGFGFPPRIKAWKKGETEYSVNWLPFGGFVRIGGENGEFAMLESEKDGPADANAAAVATTTPTAKPVPDEDTARLFYTQPAWKKSLIMLAGVAVNFLLGWFFLALVLAIGAPQAVVITGIQPDSPAAQAGIMANDVLQGFASAQNFIDYVNAHRGTPITVTVTRNDKTLSFNVTPRVNPGPDEGALGVELEEAGQAREPVFMAVWDGLVNAGIVFVLTAQAFFQLFQQLFVHASLLPGVVGPVGIFGVAEETGKIGLVYLLQLIGIISINLTIVNLIPFPALDGGRFVMVIIEKIKGSAISFRTQAIVNGLGFAFLILLMVLLTIRDVRGLV